MNAGNSIRRGLAGRRRVEEQLALGPLHRRIQSFDPWTRHRYVERLYRSYRGYETEVPTEELTRQACNSDIVLVGDFHAHRAYQRFASQLLVRLSSSSERPCALALECFLAGDQPVISSWQRGQISDESLRRQVRFNSEWGFAWRPILALLHTARNLRMPVIGLDCTPRTGAASFEVRDRHAAQRLADYRSARPDHGVIVLFGESHLAPQHLPAELSKLLPKERVLTVLQNLDAVYWRLPVGAGPGTTVRIAPRVFCAFNATPVEKYQSYSMYIDRWCGR